jgi:hypothetical protein
VSFRDVWSLTLERSLREFFRLGDRQPAAVQQRNVWVRKNNDPVFGHMLYGSGISLGCFFNNNGILRLRCSVVDKISSLCNRPRRLRGGIEL